VNLPEKGGKKTPPGITLGSPPEKGGKKKLVRLFVEVLKLDGQDFEF
jgi:hypothetical protein